MKIHFFLLFISIILTISSCEPNSEKSKSEDGVKANEIPTNSGTYERPLVKNDTLNSNGLIKKQKINEATKPEPDPDINVYILVDEEPKAINYDETRKAIGYPAIAKDSAIKGIVIVKVLVGKDGKYVKHRIIKKSHPLLNDAVEPQVKNLIFTPALKEGKPIKVWTTLAFHFPVKSFD
jgi:protein TonB